MTEKVRHIIYIEDEQEMIDLVRLILSRQHYEITGATGGREGLNLVRQSQPDVILLDLMMPDMDGWEVYHHLKADDSTKVIPVIVISAKAQKIDKVLGIRIAKVDGYITKPFTPRELVQSVENVLEKRTITR